MTFRFICFCISFFLIFSACDNTQKPPAIVEKTPSENQQKNNTLKKNSKDLKGEFEFSGVIMSSGLSSADIQHLNLKNTPKFQLLNNKENEFYFLNSPSEKIESYWGKCVYIQGTKDSITTPSKINFPNYSLLNPTHFSMNQNCDYCGNEPRKKLIKKIEKSYGKDFPTKTLKGKIERNKRPSFDISYDYRIKLSIPEINENDPRGDGFETHSYVIIPANNTMRLQFEKIINSSKEISLEGFLVGGYAESLVLHVIDIRE